MGSRNKLVIIGLDGATFNVIEPMVRSGGLPVMAQLLRSGSSGMLGSTYPPLTPPAWTTFSTGKNPGKHGVFDFLTKPYCTDPPANFTNFNSIKCATFWEILRDTDLRFGIVNLPMTYPPPSLEGFVISGMDTPNDRVIFSYPEELIAELRTDGIPYQVRFFPREQRRPKDRKQTLERFFRIEEERKNAFLYLIRKKKWDIFVGVFMLLDKVQHFFWHEHGRHRKSGDPGDEDAICQAYRLIDRFVGDIVSAVGEHTYVMLVSDHGFGEVKRIFFINEWLRREGLLTLKKRDPVTFLRHVTLRKIEKTGSQVLGRLGLMGLGKILPSRLLTNRFRLYLPAFRYSASSIDWPRTKAYGASYGIYVNLEGRTPHGIVEPGPEYEKTRESIQDRLSNFTDTSTGEKPDLELLKKEEVYSGPYVSAAPDLVFDFKKSTVLPSHAFKFSGILAPRRHFGTHHYEGIFLLRGPGVKPGHRIDGCVIADVTPTIFYLLGQPVPNDFDGNVLKDAFLTDFLQRHPISFQEPIGISPQRGDERKTYTPEEASEIAEKLRNLGYLD